MTKPTTWPRLNLAAGPVQVMDQTLRDAARPVLYHYDPAFIELFARTSDLLKQVFRTEYDVVIMQGEAILGLEAAAAGLLSPGDKVLNLVSGVFGKWFEDFIHKYGGETIELAVPYNDAIDPEDVRKALHANPGVKFLSVVHSETPSGTHNPVREIGAVAREFGVHHHGRYRLRSRRRTAQPRGVGHGRRHRRAPEMPRRHPRALADVDQPGGLGGAGGAQTGTAARQLPLDPRLEERLAGRQALPLHPLGQRDLQPGIGAASRRSTIGMERFVDRHQAIARACREGVKALGLELWPAREEIAAACVTAVRMPEGIDDAKLRGTMRHRYGVDDLARLRRAARASSSGSATWARPRPTPPSSPRSSPCWSARWPISATRCSSAPASAPQWPRSLVGMTKGDGVTGHG